MTDYSIKIFDLTNGSTIIGKIDKTASTGDLLYIVDPALMLEITEYDSEENPIGVKHIYAPYVQYSRRNTFIFNPASVISFSIPYDSIQESYLKYINYIKTGIAPDMEDDAEEELDSMQKKDPPKKYLH
jgi:hypothetical protein